MTSIGVASVGDNCIDCYMPPVGLSTVGGNALNVAVHLKLMGHKAAYFGAVGSDEDGRRVSAVLEDHQLPTEYVRRTAGRTAYTEIGSDPAGDRIILFEDFGVC